MSETVNPGVEGSRKFHIGALLNLVPGVLCSRDGMGDVYDLLGHLTGDRGIMTHQLPRAAGIAEPYLLDQHPWLREVPDHDGFVRDRATADEWVARMAARFGEWHPVAPLPTEAWGRRDPIADAVEIFGDRVIVVET